MSQLQVGSLLSGKDTAMVIILWKANKEWSTAKAQLISYRIRKLIVPFYLVQKIGRK